MAWLSYTLQNLGTTSVSGLCDRGIKPVSWTVQCTALVMGQRTAHFGRAVDELSLAHAIDDIVKAGCVRTLPAKSSVAPTQLEVPTQLVPQETSWYYRKAILANTVHVRYGFNARPSYRPQDLHMDWKIAMAKVGKVLGNANHPLIQLTENIYFLFNDLALAKSGKDRVIAWSRFFAQGRPGGVLFNTLVTIGTIVECAGDLALYFWETPTSTVEERTEAIRQVFQPQSLLDVLEGGVKFAEDGLENMGKLWASPTVETIKSIYIVGTALLVYGEEGVDPNKITKEQIDRLRATCSRKTWYFTNNPAEFIARSTLFILRAVIASLRNKSWIPMLGDEGNVTTWSLEASRLTSLATNLATLEAHGTDIHTFTKDLNAAIQSGQVHVRTTTGFVQRECLNLLGKLQVLRNDTLSRTVASKMRDPPFAVLVTGGTSLGKSTILDMLFNYFAEVRGLPKGEQFRYPRNSGEEHWNNFNSSHWCIVFDEIAPLNPQFMKEPDQTTKDVLGVCNSMPYNPNQASLDDKGKTPCLAKLVLGSSNVFDLNAPVFFENPTAVLRRFHMVVDVKVKKQYSKPGGMLDYTKTTPDAFADYWELAVWKAVPEPKKGTAGKKQQLGWELIAEFTEIGSFLLFTRGLIEAHQRECSSMKTSLDVFKNDTLCATCGVFTRVCVCEANLASRCRTCSGECTCDFSLRPQVQELISPPPAIPQDWLDYRTYLSLSWRDALNRFGCAQCWKWFKRSCWIKTLPVVLGFVSAQHIFRNRTLDFGLYCFVQGVGDIANWSRSKKVLAIVTALTFMGSSAWAWYEWRKSKTKPIGLPLQTLEEEIKASKMNQEEVWYKDDYRTTYVDVGRQTLSWARMEQAELTQRLANNIARIRCDRRVGVAFCLGGNLWVTNAHFFRTHDQVHWVDFHFGGGLGVSQDVLSLRVDPECRVHSDETDTVYMWLPNMTPRKTVTQMLPHRSLKGEHAGFVLSRSLSDEYELKSWRFMHSTLQVVRVADSDKYLHQWKSTVENTTREGDCGSVAISMSRLGPIILGFHSLGDKNTACFQPIWLEEVDKVTQHFVPMLLSGGRMMLPKGSPSLVPVIHAKSPLRYLEDGSCIPIGTFLGARAEPKTKVCDSQLRKPLEDLGWECNFYPPAMKGWLPKRNALKDVVSPHSPFNAVKLRAIADEVADDIIAQLPDGWEKELGFVSLDVALNGIPGVAHMDRLNVSSSCGFPYGGPKKKFLSDDVGDYSGTLVLDEEIARQVADIMECWRQGETAGVVINANLKDEPRSKEKVENHNTRMFQAAPMAFTICTRMVLLPLLRLFYNCHEAFCSAPGMDASSGEWDQMFRWMNEFKNAIDGDFKKFDTLLRGDVMHAVYWIMYRICTASGQYSEEQLKIMYANVMECCYIIMNFFGDVIQLFGINSSGNAATVFFNCMANLIILRYVYSILSPHGNSKDFLKFVRLMLYGDDNLCTVSDEIPWFNFREIQRVLKGFGIDYTPAKKTEGPYDYKKLEEAEFLKRGFRFDPYLGHYLAPLSRASLSKMVMVQIPSSSVTLEKQTIDSVSSAVREAFLHGRDVFDSVVGDLQKALLQTDYVDIPSYVFPTYDQLVMQYAIKSQTRDYFRGSREPERFKSPVLAVTPDVKGESPNQIRGEESSNCATLGQEVASVEAPSNQPERSSNTLFRDGEGGTPNGPKTPSSVASRAEEVNNHASNLRFQTGEEDDLVQNVTAETTQFTSATVGDVAGFNATPDVPRFGSADLGKFLSRPVQIGYLLWTPGTLPRFAMMIYPWYEFFNNAYIKQKVANFGLVRGNLHIKVLVNATPFVYGSALMSYWPLCGLNRDNAIAGPNIEVLRSQRPSIWIDPSASRGGELTLPFFYPRDFLELGSAFAMKSMGRLDFDVVAALQSATTSANIDCSVQVYAWLEDVELAAPTVGSLLALQTRDEYTGPISGPASAVAALSSRLSTMPVIGRAATAAQLGSTAIAKISSLFGFSNVTDLSGPSSIYSQGFPAMSTVGQSHPVAKLSLDPKTELGVSAKSVGLQEENQLLVSSLVQREAYLGQFSWDPATGTDTLLFSGRISPMMYAIREVGVNPELISVKEILMSPMCMVAKMFRYWRGDIYLRFKFVSTPYHRGRLIISYDPTGDVTSNLNNKVDTTAVVQTYVVDLATVGDTRDFEVRIPYSQASPWCSVEPRMDDTNLWTHFGDPWFYRSPETDNGTVTVRVQTELSSPSGTGTVPILVFARGGDNLEFGGPGIDAGQELSFFTPQTLDTDPMEEHQDTDLRYLLNMGEKISDLRTLLQRRTLMYSTPLAFVGGSNHERVRYVLSRTPLQRGFDPNGPNVSGSVMGASPSRCTYSQHNFLTWMWPHFAAHRGAVEYTVNVDSPAGLTALVSRAASENSPSLGTYTAQATGSSAAAIANFYNKGEHGTGGMAVINTKYQPTVTVALPMYHYNKFAPNNIGLALANEVDNATWPWLPAGENYTWKHMDLKFDKLVVEGVRTNPNTSTGKFDFFVAGGSDFSLLWFVGCAPVWEYALTPV